jgi:putative oxidoreductase
MEMKMLLSSSPIWKQRGLAIVRIILGGLLIYHGQEVFDKELMNGYAQWDTFKNTTGLIMVYFGKSSELIAGVLLLLGLFTRLGTILIIGTFFYITFFVGHGKFWYEDQHPFMFLMFGLLFFFTGPGAWSIESLFNNKVDSTNEHEK